MFEFITNFLEHSGYLGLFALMALENIFPPIPSEMIMPFAGFVAARGELNLVGVLLAGTAGSVAGALPWYYAARIYGCERLKRLAA
jgi:membrane protein DedA with SNARE-associated domain